MIENYSFLPVYDFSPEINAELVRKILPMMTQHNVPINPLNYAIWYEYAAGTNNKLISALDELLEQQQAIDPELSLNLYKKFVCNVSIESYEKINHQLQHIFSQVSDSIIVTHHKTVEANQSFEKNTNLLENLSEQAGLREILHNLIQETKALSETSLAMQAKLDEANQEIELLRSELGNVRTLALTDSLTGLLNRRGFDQTLDMLMKQTPISTLYLVKLDIDHFKRITETHGHMVSDHIIKYVVTLMKKHTDSNHHLARINGEEMAIIIAYSTLEKVYALTENIRSSLEKSLLKRKDNKGSLGKITISVGIAAGQNDEDAESFIKRADNALYTAKVTGRNRIVCAK